DNTIFIKTLFKNICFYNVRAKNVYLDGAYLNNDSIVKQAKNNTEKQANDNIDKQVNDSTDKQANNSTELPPQYRFNQARLKEVVNIRFSIPGLTSYQPTYIVEE
ncbi:type III effector, partial [Escherichia coli]|nr:type III effector [Escherichia coli]